MSAPNPTDLRRSAMGQALANTCLLALATVLFGMLTSGRFTNYLQTWFKPYLLVATIVMIALSLCSEADAFVVSSLTSVSPTAQLTFLVVGPMVDIKLFAMQSGAFGTRFSTRFMPLTLMVCVLASILVGRLMFGTF